jgi:hypothetical protein
MANQPSDALIWKYIANQCDDAEKIWIESLIKNDTNFSKKYNRIKLYQTSNQTEENSTQGFDTVNFAKLIFQKNNKFEQCALELFSYQAKKNPTYKEFLELLHIDISQIKSIQEIPFLPIDFFKTRIIKTSEWETEKIFLSSGTSQMTRSAHHIKSLNLYHQSILNGLGQTTIPFNETHIIAYLPSYYDNPSSSLLYMVNFLMTQNKNKQHSFIQSEEQLHDYLKNATEENILLFGVSFALYDFAIKHKNLKNKITIIETGGMKSSGRTLSKTEIFEAISNAFPKANIYSEYGMTEMLSQAYTNNQSLYFNQSNTMNVFVNDENSPRDNVKKIGRGRINIIDLCNIDSCAFLQTGDTGEIIEDGRFLIHGRVDIQDIRGCHLLMEEL